MRLSPTLFRYIFWDLLKVFLMANGALAGILSFGGLLRPLTQQGLDVGQVGKMLAFFTPAMTAYSLPVAALFATTFVYGRLSADNEIVACRASGVSHMALAVPAVALGLVVSLISLLLLLFIVPNYTLKVEKVVSSNIAKLIATRIDRTHQIRFGPVTVFAEAAHLPPFDPASGVQQVVLVSPTIVTFEQPDKKDKHFKVPKDFHVASQATVNIYQNDGDERVMMMIGLEEGSKFPRNFAGAQLGGVGSAQFGPIEMPSPMKEDTKFMDLWQLRRLEQNLNGSRKIQTLVADMVRYDQEVGYVWSIRDALNRPAATTAPARQQARAAGAAAPAGEAPARRVVFNADQTYVLEYRGAAQAVEKEREVIVGEPANLQQRTVRFRIESRGQTITTIDAREARVRARPLAAQGLMDVTVELFDVEVTTREGTGGRRSVSYPLRVAMPPEVAKMGRRTFADYKNNPAVPEGTRRRLNRELAVLTNDLQSEGHGRASFAVSCLVLVGVGCALGMMFRSGAFLTAFAVSFVPALVSITLIVAGQRVCGSVPLDYPKHANPIQLGLTLIWAGNAANAVIAAVLLGRLQRQ